MHNFVGRFNEHLKAHNCQVTSVRIICNEGCFEAVVHAVARISTYEFNSRLYIECYNGYNALIYKAEYNAGEITNKQCRSGMNKNFIIRLHIDDNSQKILNYA